jgi:hypothetical protein
MPRVFQRGLPLRGGTSQTGFGSAVGDPLAVPPRSSSRSSLHRCASPILRRALSRAGKSDQIDALASASPTGRALGRDVRLLWEPPTLAFLLDPSQGHRPQVHGRARVALRSALLAPRLVIVVRELWTAVPWTFRASPGRAASGIRLLRLTPARIVLDRCFISTLSFMVEFLQTLRGSRRTVAISFGRSDSICRADAVPRASS